MNGEVGLQAKTLSLSAGLESVCLECICYIYYLSCHSFYLDSRLQTRAHRRPVWPSTTTDS